MWGNGAQGVSRDTEKVPIPNHLIRNLSKITEVPNWNHPGCACTRNDKGSSPYRIASPHQGSHVDRGIEGRKYVDLWAMTNLIVGYSVLGYRRNDGNQRNGSDTCQRLDIASTCEPGSLFKVNAGT